MVVVHSALAQDPTYGVKGYLTEPVTGITFWTTTFPNGTLGGWGSLYSNGGYTFGIALPENAATVDSADYIGILVCVLLYISQKLQPLTKSRSAPCLMVRVGLELCMAVVR